MSRTLLNWLSVGAKNSLGLSVYASDSFLKPVTTIQKIGKKNVSARNQVSTVSAVPELGPRERLGAAPTSLVVSFDGVLVCVLMRSPG